MSIYSTKPWLKQYDHWVPAEMNPPRQSVYHALMLAASQWGDKPATAFLGAEMTYAELRNRVDRLATALYSMGIRKGDRVGVMLPNCPQYLISFYAILRLGAMVTNCSPLYTPRELEHVAKDSGMRAIITLEALAPAVLSIAPLTSIEHVLASAITAYSATPPPQAAPPEGTLSFEGLIAATSEINLPRIDIHPDNDIAVLAYTGGTTGIPKAAMLTHSNIYSNALQMHLWGKGLITKGTERMLLVIPLFHIYGQVTGMVLNVYEGGMGILIPKFDVNAVIEAFRRYSPTRLMGVPTLYISLLNHPDAKTCGLHRVKAFHSGSAPLPVEVIAQFEQLSGGCMMEGYGLTEASPTTHTTPVLGWHKAGSVGLPMPSTEVKIVDLETGEREMLLGEEGELCIRGPQVMKGYWNNPEETAIALRNGWLYTGDIARVDADGFCYIVQRKKDMIIVSGFKVFPNEVEDVLFTHAAVMEAGVIGIGDPYRGEAVKAFVVKKPGHDVTAEELTEYCKARLAKYKVPSQIEFVEGLPKSGVGKVLRRALREQELAKAAGI